MSEDLVAGIDRLIDGDMDRQERLSLLWTLAHHPRACDILMETLRFDVEMMGLAGAYRQLEPRPGALDGIFAALAADQSPGLLSRAVDSVRDTLRQMTRMNDAELGMAMGGSAPPPAYDGGEADDTADWQPDPLHPASLPSARPVEAGGRAERAPRFQLVEGQDGRLAFPRGSGSLRAAPSVELIELGPVGPREEGGWVLRLIAGEARPAGPDRLDIVGTPDAGGCLILLDGSSLLFTGPLSIRWKPADEEAF